MKYTFWTINVQLTKYMISTLFALISKILTEVLYFWWKIMFTFKGIVAEYRRKINKIYTVYISIQTPNLKCSICSADWAIYIWMIPYTTLRCLNIYSLLTCQLYWTMMILIWWYWSVLIYNFLLMAVRNHVNWYENMNKTIHFWYFYVFCSL